MAILTPAYQDKWATVYLGDVMDVLAELPEESVNCVITSPPYWGLRDYEVQGQIGLEQDLYEYIDKLVEVFREVRRVLRSDGVFWLNMGDTFAGSGRGPHCLNPDLNLKTAHHHVVPINLKRKDLCGIPWRTVLALQYDGWWWRSECIWWKIQPQPETASDRPSRDHEPILLLTKSARYWWDEDAIKEPCSPNTHTRKSVGKKALKVATPTSWADKGKHDPVDFSKVRRNGRPPRPRNNPGFAAATIGTSEFRRKRTVWRLPQSQYHGDHFATFPEDLVKPCILAGCPEGGTVLDPFSGSGTVCQVAKELNRKSIGIEINPKDIELHRERLAQEVLDFT